MFSFDPFIEKALEKLKMLVWPLFILNRLLFWRHI